MEKTNRRTFKFEGKEYSIDSKESYNKWVSLWNSFDDRLIKMMEDDFENFVNIFKAITSFEENEEIR